MSIPPTKTVEHEYSSRGENGAVFMGIITTESIITLIIYGMSLILIRIYPNIDNIIFFLATIKYVYAGGPRQKSWLLLLLLQSVSTCWYSTVCSTCRYRPGAIMICMGRVRGRRKWRHAVTAVTIINTYCGSCV